MRASLIVIGMILVSVAVFASGAMPVQTYTGFYTGHILPTPREVEYGDEAWLVAERGAGEARACVIAAEVDESAAQIAAQQIALRIQYLSGGATVQETADAAAATIRLGLAGDDEFARDHLQGCPLAVPEHPEGYIVWPKADEGHREVVLAGRSAAGLTFAAQTLVQLFGRSGGDVLLHPAQIRDWPEFQLRSFKVGGGFGPDSKSMTMGLWAPFAKFNCYNICYTTLGRNKWVAPDPGYVEHVRKLARYMRNRGLDCMPFVNPYYLWEEHIEVSDPEDLARLHGTCTIGLNAGGERVMLCLDDFASKPDRSGPKLYHVRSESDRAQWDDDLAAVNVAMINDLNRRVSASHPDCKLYAVLPYYWNPKGSYQEGGEQYLKAIGEGVDDEVRIVWTGPNVRSAVITEGNIDYYQGLLGGRKVMLWDNTLYMHHSPPHYFLDSFHTVYPEGFADLISGEVHFNAGGGEAYKCGLLAAADYLWNPASYDAESSIRNAIGAIAGPDVVEDLLAFRDTFYELYDDYAGQLGDPSEFLAMVKDMEQRPFDKAGIAEVLGLLGRERSLADDIAANCSNEGLVAEVREHVAMHAGYREAFELLAKLPPMSEGEAANIAPNPGAEEVTDSRPAHWRTYTGAGRCTLGLAPGHTGENCGKLAATELYDWKDGRKSINVALMIGETDGYTGTDAPEIRPLHRYYFSFWLRGNAPRVIAAFTTWDESGERGTRGFARTGIEAFAAPEDWTFYHGAFVTPPDAARGALKIGIEGYVSEGGGLGEIFVDDVYVGRSRAEAMKSAPEGVE